MPDGEIGEIVVAGPVVTETYYNRPEATSLAKIADPDPADIFSPHGRPRLSRQSGPAVVLRAEVAPGGAGTRRPFSPSPASRSSTRIPKSRGRPWSESSGDGRVVPVICIEPSSGCADRSEDRLRARIARARRGFPHTWKIRTILFHRSFPVDIRHNAKIFREKLAVWASRRLS